MVEADPALVIIVLPGGAEGASLLELARDWTSFGYLGRTFWVRPEDVQRRGDAPPVVPATVFGRDLGGALKEVHRDLFHLMATRSLHRITLLTVRSARPDQAGDAAQDSIRRTITEYVQHAVPKEPVGSTAASLRIDLSRVTLICAPTEFTLKERVDWVAGDDTLTVVASPEDRATPWSGDAFVRDDERFEAFVLMHAVTAVGAWIGLPYGLPELLERDHSATTGVWLTRVFVGGIVTTTLENAATLDVVRSAADPDSRIVDPYSGVLADGTAPIPHRDVARYREAMVRAAIDYDGAVLRYRRQDAEPSAERPRISPSRQWRAFVGFCRAVLAGSPAAWWSYVRRGFARMLGRRLQGDDRGLYVVDGELDRLDQQDRMIADALANVRSQQADLGISLELPVPAAAAGSTPMLWSALRQAVFGALDGGGDPEERGFPVVEGRIPVFARVADVLHDPGDVWDAPAGLVDGLQQVEPLDERSQRSVRSAIASRLANAQTAQATAEAAIAGFDRETVELADRRAQARPFLAHAGVLETDDDGHDRLLKLKEVALPPGVDRAQVAATFREFKESLARSTALVALRHEAELGQEDAIRAIRDAERLSANFETWAARQGSNVGAGLLHAVETERESAELDASAAATALTTFRLPATGRLRELRDRYHRRAAILAAVVVLLVAGVILWDPSIELGDWPGWLVFGLAGLGFLLVGLVLLLVRYYRDWSAFHRSILDAESQLFELHDRGMTARREAFRLAGMSEQTRDWLDLLAAAMRRPWTAQEPSGRAGDALGEDAGSDDSAERAAKLPFALRLATADLSDQALARQYRRTAAEALVKRGWRSDAFVELLGAISTTQGIAAEAVDLDALDRDLPHLPNQARKIARENMGRDEVLEQVGAYEIERIRHDADFAPLNAAISDVVPLMPDPLAELVDGDSSPRIGWSEFLGAPFGDPTDRATPLTPLAISRYQLQDGHHEQVRSFALAREKVAEILGLSARADLSVRTIDDRSRSFEAAIRIDLIGPIPVDAVRLGISPVGTGAEPERVVPRKDRPRSGQYSGV
ncbi:hypothetical protein [Agromyces sp. Marseille-Q5079]|uniref:hypothetical protein n=1 Tax=Agromyces sp. Marseille-Q5079 TaxID=3439059 RepID=UPI003D9C8B17